MDLLELRLELRSRIKIFNSSSIIHNPSERMDDDQVLLSTIKGWRSGNEFDLRCSVRSLFLLECERKDL